MRGYELKSDPATLESEDIEKVSSWMADVEREGSVRVESPRPRTAGRIGRESLHNHIAAEAYEDAFDEFYDLKVKDPVRNSRISSS